MNKEEGDGRPSKDWNYISRARLARLGEHIAFAAKTLDASTDHTRPRFAAPGNAHPFCFPTNCYGSEPSFSGPPCRPIRPQCCIPPSHSARGVMPASVTHSGWPARRLPAGMRPAYTKHSSECQHLLSVSVSALAIIPAAAARTCGNDGWHIPSIMLVMPHKLRIHTIHTSFCSRCMSIIAAYQMLQPDSQSKSMITLPSMSTRACVDGYAQSQAVVSTIKVNRPIKSVQSARVQSH